MWFKVSDDLAFHPKAVQAGNEAMGVWVRMGAWAGFARTGGLVPKGVALAIAGAMAPVLALEQAGLLIDEGEQWKLHDWEVYNPTAEQADRLHKIRSEAGRLGAAKRWNGRVDREADAMADAIADGMAKGSGTGSGEEEGEVSQVWDRYAAARAARWPATRDLKLSAKRRGHIRQRLRDFGLERVMAAVDKFCSPRFFWGSTGAAKDPSLLFRSIDQFEKVEAADPYHGAERGGAGASGAGQPPLPTETPIHSPLPGDS